MTKVVILNSDGSFGEVDITSSDEPSPDSGSFPHINCGNATTDPNPILLNCGGA